MGKLRSISFYAYFLLAALTSGASPANAKTPCEALVHSAVPGAKIISAVFVPATQSTLSDQGETKSISVTDVCRVEGLIGRTIRFAVWMPPADKWNGKFVMFGGGGFAGFISYFEMAEAAARGYATASTDTGHDTSNVSWLNDHERVIDYAFRAVHETAFTAKGLVARFYGAGAKKSLFAGCSNGGRQGLMEVQRYPDDFDGVISGAPAADYTGLLLTQVWYHHAAFPGQPGQPSLLPAKALKLVQDAAIAKCDELDGVIEDPTQCKFDPAVLQCTASNGSNCLTADQVAAVRQVYGGVPGFQAGVSRMPGLEPGGEAGWAVYTEDPQLTPHVQAIFEDIVFRDEHWNWRNFKFPNDDRTTDDAMASLFNADNPDIRRFVARGGKLIVYQGWNDNIVAPTNPIAYYEQVRQFMKTDPESFFRLFMVPGMNHCQGGPGTGIFDKIGPLDAWVANNDAPERIVASHTKDAGPMFYFSAEVPKGSVIRTRPLCPYPNVAHWTGQGSTDSAENFTCVESKSQAHVSQ